MVAHKTENGFIYQSISKSQENKTEQNKTKQNRTKKKEQNKKWERLNKAKGHCHIAWWPTKLKMINFLSKQKQEDKTEQN